MGMKISMLYWKGFPKQVKTARIHQNMSAPKLGVADVLFRPFREKMLGGIMLDST